MSNKETEYFNFIDSVDINKLKLSDDIGKNIINQILMLKISSILYKYTNISYFSLSLMYGTNPDKEENPGEKPYLRSELTANQKIVKNFNFYHKFNFSKAKIDGVYNKFTFKEKIDHLQSMFIYYPGTITDKDFGNWCFSKLIYRNQMNGENFFTDDEKKIMDFLILQENINKVSQETNHKSKNKI